MDALTWRVTIWQRRILCWLWVCGGCAVAVGRTINKLATFAASNSTICVVRQPFCCVDVVTIAIITAIAVAVAGVARPDVDDDVGSVASLKRIRIVAEWWDHDTNTCKRAGRIICCADGMHNLRIVLPGIYPARIRKFSYVKVPLPVIAKDRPPPPTRRLGRCQPLSSLILPLPGTLPRQLALQRQTSSLHQPTQHRRYMRQR